MGNLQEFIRSAIFALTVGMVTGLPGLRADEALSGAELQESVVQALVTYQQNNPLYPWQKQRPGFRSGYAVAVGPDTVLTTESLVRNHQLIELRRALSGKKVRARVVIAEPQVNLALLRVSDPDELGKLTPLEPRESLARDDTVEIVQLDKTTQILRSDARVLQMAMSKLPDAPYGSLMISVVTDLNVNGMGAPVLLGDRLAGVVMNYRAATRVADMIPYPIIQRFLARNEDGEYAGFASAGFTWTRLVDPAKRRYLGVTEPDRGVVVLSCLPFSGAAEALQPNDVILEWDGEPVGNLGFYQDKDFGRLTFSFLIKGRRSPGEEVPVKIVRDREPLDVTVKLTRHLDHTALVPENVMGQPAPYLMEGGLILMELTGDYLRAHGNDWQRKIDPRLTHVYYTLKDRPEKPGDRIVILASILNDPANITYQKFPQRIVTHVNEAPISSMADVFRIVDRDGHLTRVTLQGVGIDLVLAPELLGEANARLERNYRIPSLRRETPLGPPAKDK